MTWRLPSLPKCSAVGCEAPSDPRFAIHGPGGKPAPACDGHGNPGCDGDPCTCPPSEGGPVPNWQAAMDRVRRRVT